MIFTSSMHAKWVGQISLEGRGGFTFALRPIHKIKEKTLRGGGGIKKWPTERYVFCSRPLTDESRRGLHCVCYLRHDPQAKFCDDPSTLNDARMSHVEFLGISCQVANVKLRRGDSPVESILETLLKHPIKAHI